MPIPFRLTYGSDPATTYHISINAPNELKGIHSFSFKKVDSFGADLSGAVFGLYPTPACAAADEIKTATSDSSGVVKFIELKNTESGKREYYVKEKTAPGTNAYILSDAVIQVEINGGDTNLDNTNATFSIISNPSGDVAVDGKNVTFTNTNIGSLEITKKDAADNAVFVSGAEFTLYECDSAGDNRVYKDKKYTGAYGKCTFTGLVKGKYYIAVETAVGDAYIADSVHGPFEITAIGNLHQTATLTNNRAKSFSFDFIKQDDHNNVLAGAEFGLFSDSGCNTPVTGFAANGSPASSGTQITAISGSDGKVVFGETGALLPFGTYYVQELTAPPKAGNTIYVKSDVRLKVDIKNDGSYTIEAAGGTTADFVAPSTSPVQKGQPSGAVVKNELLGSITVTKQDDDNANATITADYATFEVRDGSAAGTLVGTAQNTVDPVDTTTVTGVTTFTGLKLEHDYYLVETKAPTKYRVSEPIPFRLAYGSNPAATYHIGIGVPNELKGVHSFSFQKEDSFGTVLNGAVFGLYSNEACTVEKQTATSGENDDTGLLPAATPGAVQFTELKNGTYYVKEKTAPGTDGYIKSGAVIKVVIDGGDQDDGNASATFSIISNPSGDVAINGQNVTFTNANNGSLEITKTDAIDNTTPVSGAEFTLYECDSTGGNRVYKDKKSTGADGKCKFTGLVKGKYYIAVETAATAAYVPDSVHGPITITAIENLHQTAALTNNRAKAFSVGFIKKDNYNNALAGATFGLFSDSGCTKPVTGFNTDGSPISSGAQITATSGSDGKVVFGGASKLPFGTYYVQEISAPSGGTNSYVKSGVIIKIDIKSDGRYDIGDGSSSIQNVTKNTVSVFEVKNELLGSITVIKQDKFGRKIKDVDFTLSSDPAGVTESGTTDNDGSIKFTDLTLGKTYNITEDTTPAGYDAPVSPTVTLELRYDSGNHRTVTVTNKRTEQYSLELVKQDPFGSPLQGAIFGIMQVNDDKTYSTGMALTADKSATSNANGKVLFDGNLSFGRFFIWEMTPPAGYSLSDAVIQADISFDGSSIVLTRVSGNDVTQSGGQTYIKNERGKHVISFNKTSKNTGDALAGAEFSITPTADSSGKTVTMPADTYETAVSDPQGKVTFGNLPFGAYLIEEVSAPKNYAKIDGSFKVEIAIDGKVKFSSAVEDENIEIAEDGSTATVTNAYTPPSTGSGGRGGSSGGSGGGTRVDGTPPPSTTSPTGGSTGTTTGSGTGSGTLTPATVTETFPPGSTVTKPTVIKEEPDYNISAQTVTIPKDETREAANKVEVITITVTNPAGAVIGELAPPPPRVNYVFEGWYLDPEMTIPYRPGDKLPEGTLNVYAKWYYGEKDLANNTTGNANDNPETGYYPYYRRP